MFRLEMLPAANGDCLWLEYGSADRVHRVLVDTGWAKTYPDLRRRILALPKSERVFELLVITHIDADHIQGAVPLLQDDVLGCTFKDVWYNGWRHIEHLGDAPPPDVLGAREGEFIGVLLGDLALPWNANPAFAGGPVMVPAAGGLPVTELEGGMRLTLLSPGREQLVGLVDTWRDDAAKAGFVPGDEDAVRAQLRSGKFAAVQLDELGDDTGPVPTPEDVLGETSGPAGGDTSGPNGSSIAVLAEFEGKRALLTGDAWPSVLVASLQRLGVSVDAPLKVDTWKLAHHGSWANISETLVRMVSTPRVLVSTNGSTFGHPHRQAIDLLLHCRPGRGAVELVFNYRAESTEPWVDPPRGAGFRSTYPAGVSMLL